MKKILLSCVVITSCLFANTKDYKQLEQNKKIEKKEKCDCFTKQKTNVLNLLKKEKVSQEKIKCVEKSKNADELRICKPTTLVKENEKTSLIDSNTKPLLIQNESKSLLTK